MKTFMSDKENMINGETSSFLFVSSHSRVRNIFFALSLEAKIFASGKNVKQIIFQFKLHKIFTQDHWIGIWYGKCDKNTQNKQDARSTMLRALGNFILSLRHVNILKLSSSFSL